MGDMPPRRSRRASNDSEPSLPLIPILIGVIVLGFVIGAGLSIARKHGAPPQNVVVNAPTQRPPTDAPVTPAPTEKPTRTPTEDPQAVATEAATGAPPSPTPRPSRAALPASIRSPLAASPPRIPAPSPATVPAPPTRAMPPVKRSAAPVAAAPVARVATDAPASADDVDSEFGRLASQVVRQYLAAVARGDTPSAYAAFGASSGDANVHLTETGIVGPGARIQHVEVRGAGDNATVNVDLKTPGGVYLGQYTVHRTPSGAALIVDHSIVKP